VNLPLAQYALTVYASRRLGIAKSTISERLFAVASLGAFLDRKPTLADLTEANLLGLLHNLAARSRSASTINSKRRALRTIWQDAYQQEYLPTPPPIIPPMPEQPRMPEAWTIDEISGIVQAAGRESGVIAGLPAGLFWQSLILSALDTGARIGALSKVRTIDVRLDGDAPGILLVAEFAKTKRPEWRPLHPQTIEACRRIWQSDRGKKKRRRKAKSRG